MNDVVKGLCLAILLLLIDLPWLYIQGPVVQDIIQDIQGNRPMNPRLWGAIPVYIALAYVLTQITSAPRAFIMGLSSYAVYDFTQVVTFDKYPVWFACADTLWGGVLMAVTWWLGASLNLVTPLR